MPKNLMLKLKQHRKCQLEHRLKLGQAYQNLDLVLHQILERLYITVILRFAITIKF